MAIISTPVVSRMTIGYVSPYLHSANFNNLNPNATPQELASFVGQIAGLQNAATIRDVRLITENLLTNA